MSATRKTLLQAIEENTAAVQKTAAENVAHLRAVCDELRRSRDQKHVQTKRKRAKVLEGVVRSKMVPVSDIAAASANRALQKLDRH